MSWSKRLQSLISIFYYLIFLLVPLVWLPNTSELFEFNKLILTYILTTLIVGTWAIRCIVENKFIFKRTLLDWPILIFLISQSLSLLFSIDPHVSWLGYYSRWNGGLLSLLSYSLLYWAFVSNMDSKSSLRAVHCALWAAAIVAIYGSLEHFGLSISCLLTTGSFNVACWVQDVQTRVFATLGQPNWLAAYIVALIFIPISKLISHKSYFINLSLFFLLFATLLFTKSRSGLLAFGISSVIFWGTPLLFPPKLGGNQKGVLKNLIIFLTITLTLTLTIPNPIRDLMLHSTQPLAPSTGTALESGGTESGTIRKIVWTGATRIWTSSIKNLLIGTGPETFAQAYYQYRPMQHNQTSEWELLYNKAHNEFLNYLATTGILGLVSYLVLLGSMIRIYLTPNPSPKLGEGKLASGVRYALLAGWLSISITNFWGFSVVIMQLLLFLLPAISITLHDE
ncbi:MAG: O-antigen ligase family protein [Patescibacteria group bacterium]